jgi:TRAP-type C4-dicarboxylate transport system substrate-binding protein
MNYSIRNLLWSGVAAVMSVCISSAAMAEAEFKLRWGHYLGKGPFLEVEQDFAKKIEARTNGRVKIDITFAGGLGKGNEVMTLAGRGAIDMASAPPSYYAEQLLYWKVFQMPFIFSSPEQAMDVLAKSMAEFPIYNEEMDKMNVIWLFQQPLGVYFLTGPGPNCDSVAGLKGKKLRSFGSSVPKAHAAIGAVPVSVRPVEVYEALQRGTIDYSFLNAGNIQQYKLFEPGKYSCGPIMAITGHNVVIGKKAWNRLPKDIQDIFIDQGKKSHADYLAWLSAFESKAVDSITKAGGVVKQFPSSELKKWKAAAPDTLAVWVKDMEGRGKGAMAAKVAKRWRELTGK